MQCNCNQYKKGEVKIKKEDYWTFQRYIFMGKLYKCNYCESLWAEYMGGHGWTAYYKQEADTIFAEPSSGVSRMDNKIYYDEQKMQEWNETLKTIPEEKEKIIADVIIPGDVMSILKLLFKDEKSMKHWLFTSRERLMQFETPINIMKRKGGMDSIRQILLDKYREMNQKNSI